MRLSNHRRTLLNYSQSFFALLLDALVRWNVSCSLRLDGLNYPMKRFMNVMFVGQEIAKKISQGFYGEKYCNTFYPLAFDVM